MNQEEVRQRLIELLKECTFGINNHILTDYVLEETLKSVAEHLIANGVTIRERGEWIPVTERLPEERKFVLCFYPEKDYGSKNVVDYREYHSYGFSEEFQFGRPSHWMPLPEPPEAEKGR